MRKRLKSGILVLLCTAVMSLNVSANTAVYAQSVNGDREVFPAAEEEIMEEPRSLAATLVWPVPGHTALSQGFHDGKAIDISDGSIAGAAVCAALGGTVTNIFQCGNTHHNAGDCYGFGTGLVIQGDDGRFYQYAHMQAGSIPAGISRGTRVEAGTQIGRVGMTGFAYGVHLHFGISTGTYWNESGINPQNEKYIYDNTPAEIKMSWGNDDCRPGDSDARIAVKATPSIRGTFTQAGAVVWDASGAEAASKTENINTPGSYLDIWYDIASEMGVTLKSGSAYTYQFFVVFNGTKYTSPVKNFSTLVSNSKPTDSTEPAEPGGTDEDVCSHVYSDWKTITEATVFEAEQQERECRLCGKRDIRANGTELTPTIHLNATSICLKIRQSTTKVKVSGLASGDNILLWTSSDNKIAAVDNTGKITAKNKVGSAVITVTLISGKTARIHVKVQGKTVQTTKISGLKKNLSMRVGSRATLRPVILPVTSTQKVIFRSSNTRIATVSGSGKITAKKKGRTTITVKSGRKSFIVNVAVR